MSMDRIAKITCRLQSKFGRDSVEVVDQSHLHAGHAGARDGRGHFDVYIRNDELARTGRVEAHRQVYAALDDLMQTDIHALKISIRKES